MKTKEQVISSLKKALEELDITSSLRLPIIQTIEYLQEEPASKDLNDYAKEILSWEDSNEDWDRLVIRKTAKHFTEWQKQQMMKDAIDGEIKVIYRDAVKAESIGFRTQKTGLFEGDKVKLVIIKED